MNHTYQFFARTIFCSQEDSRRGSIGSGISSPFSTNGLGDETATKKPTKSAAKFLPASVLKIRLTYALHSCQTFFTHPLRCPLRLATPQRTLSTLCTHFPPSPSPLFQDTHILCLSLCECQRILSARHAILHRALQHNIFFVLLACV